MDAQIVRIDRHIPRREPASPEQAIPAVIHQTFRTVDIPQRMHDAAMSWVKQNPAYDYRFHDDESCRNFIATHFDARVLAAYDKLEYGAFRADLWRYCLLSVEGGVYVDIDTRCQTDLRAIVRPDDGFIVPNTGNLPQAVFNAFICSTPGHPFLTAAIDRATDLIHASDTIDGYMVTGPGNLGAAMNRVLEREDKSPHVIGSAGQGTLRHRIIEKRQGPEGDRYVMDNEVVVFLTKYEGYLDDLGNSGVEHWANRPARRGLERRLRRLAKSLIGALR